MIKSGISAAGGVKTDITCGGCGGFFAGYTAETLPRCPGCGHPFAPSASQEKEGEDESLDYTKRPPRGGWF